MEFSDVDCKHELEFKNNSIAKLKEELFLANKRIELLQRPSRSGKQRSKSQHRARSISRRLRSNSSGRTRGGKRRNKKHKKRRFTKSLY